MTRRISAKPTAGAESRSEASVARTSSRYSGGTASRSATESTWPAFIAAPFMPPRTRTICWAASIWRRPSASLASPASGSRLAARVPAYLAASVAARRPSAAVRRRREEGTSFAGSSVI